MFGYLALFVCVGFSFAAIDQDVKNAVNEVTSTKDGSTFCPSLVGTKCGTSSVFHYWTCCGGSLSSECCFNLQTWVWVVISVVAVITIASFVLSIIRCICCKR